VGVPNINIPVLLRLIYVRYGRDGRWSTERGEKSWPSFFYRKDVLVDEANSSTFSLTLIHFGTIL